MALDTWAYAAVIGFALAHLLVVLYVSRRRASAGENRGKASEEERVECTACGAENDVEYRFCRRCVSELPGGVGGAPSGTSPRGRGIF